MSFCTEQESIYKNIGVIGCGASGGLVSILLSKNPELKVTAFDSLLPFTTLLPTGGGRCNLTYDEPDIREFVKNYPRGEKFLLSVFSAFNCNDTRNLFKDLGIKTYVQNDKRVFPVSDSAEKTVQILRKHLETDNFLFVKENVDGIEKKDKKFIVKTNNGVYEFDAVIIATGGNGGGYSFAENFGHKIIPVRPSLCAVNIRESFLYKLSGMSFKNCEISFKTGNKKRLVTGDILFTHKSLSGPGIFKVSALNAYSDFNDKNPLILNIRLVNAEYEEIEEKLKNNSKKSIKNAFSEFVPENYVIAICENNQIDCLKQTAQMKKSEKEILINSLLSLKLNVTDTVRDSEIVRAGGVDLNGVNAKTTESKLVKGLFFTGEVLNIDGYTGGFNLQNCWSTAVICAGNFR